MLYMNLSINIPHHILTCMFVNLSVNILCQVLTHMYISLSINISHQILTCMSMNLSISIPHQILTCMFMNLSINIWPCCFGGLWKDSTTWRKSILKMKLFIVAKKQKDEKRDQNPIIRFKEKLCYVSRVKGSAIFQWYHKFRMYLPPCPS